MTTIEDRPSGVDRVDELVGEVLHLLGSSDLVMLSTGLEELADEVHDPSVAEALTAAVEACDSFRSSARLAVLAAIGARTEDQGEGIGSCSVG